MTKSEKKKKFCSGCQQDRYNYPEIQDGEAPVVSKECCYLSRSKIVTKEVWFRSSQVKPDIIKTLDCFDPDRR